MSDFRTAEIETVVMEMSRIPAGQKIGEDAGTARKPAWTKPVLRKLEPESNEHERARKALGR